MHKVPGFWIVVFFVVGLLGCERPAEEQKVAEVVPSQVVPEQYDSHSWRDMIADNCQSYFDGCNNCIRNAGTGQAACTRKACVAYQKPHCLDPEDTQMQVIEYTCAEGGFTVYLGHYVEGDQRIALEKGNIMLVDTHSGEKSILTRDVSGSGEKYSGSGITYWNKGDNAIVHKGDEPLYRECVSQQVNDKLLSQ